MLTASPASTRFAGLALVSLLVSFLACGGDPEPVPVEPAVCGDGLRQGEEVCDDGNTTGGDGCEAGCGAVELGWDCLTPGQACVRVSTCGDGKVERRETCDDRNTAPGDGCDARCLVETGWTCPETGGRCFATACGDRIIAGDEECEDGNTTARDGCDAACRLEAGYKCETIGQPCTTTVCGDLKVEGTEQCDDGNHELGDGCSSLCTREPRCANGVCESKCGDGVLLPNDLNEECDDGNTRASDGCSPTCKLEPGFACKFVETTPPDKVSIPAVFRDFRGYDLPAKGTLPRGHIDFENNNNSETGILGALYTSLGSDGKPVYAKEGTSSATTHGRAAFDQWYRDVEGVNVTLTGSLELLRQGTSRSYVFEDATFFPLDGLGWVAQGGEEMREVTEGSVKVKHNFSFTSEVRYWFQYKGTEVLNFVGDDDVWVFINRRLALDLGGVHGAQSGTITLKNVATSLGLQVGGIYEVVVFQAERHTSASSYKLTLNDFVTRSTECTATCGNKVLDPGEACDDGINDGSYGRCARGCGLGPRCGDSIIQEASGEQCDDGNTTAHDGCNELCRVEIN